MGGLLKQNYPSDWAIGKTLCDVVKDDILEPKLEHEQSII